LLLEPIWLLLAPLLMPVRPVPSPIRLKLMTGLAAPETSGLVEAVLPATIVSSKVSVPVLSMPPPWAGGALGPPLGPAVAVLPLKVQAVSVRVPAL
jgi:hypothetical protein